MYAGEPRWRLARVRAGDQVSGEELRAPPTGRAPPPFPGRRRRRAAGNMAAAAGQVLPSAAVVLRCARASARPPCVSPALAHPAGPGSGVRGSGAGAAEAACCGGRAGAAVPCRLRAPSYFSNLFEMSSLSFREGKKGGVLKMQRGCTYLRNHRPQESLGERHPPTRRGNSSARNPRRPRPAQARPASVPRLAALRLCTAAGELLAHFLHLPPRSPVFSWLRTLIFKSMAVSWLIRGGRNLLIFDC